MVEGPAWVSAGAVSRGRLARRVRRGTAAVGVAALVLTLGGWAPAFAAAVEYTPPPPQVDAVVPGRVVPVQVPPVAEVPEYVRPVPVWPQRATGDVVVQPLPDTRSTMPPPPVRVGSLPVTVTAPRGAAQHATAAVPERVGVEVFGQDDTQAAGINGVLLRLRAGGATTTASQVRIGVGYTAFRHAFGADWASRLRLLALPECALTTPELPGCESTALASENNLAAGTVAADVSLPAASVASAPLQHRAKATGATGSATLLAVTAAPQGPAGDYGATALQASSTWTAGGSAGDFTWSYPLRMPPALGGSAPSVSLDYSSGSVDGRMAASNNQPSIIGEGFEWSPGFIERRYKTCSEDMGVGPNNTKANNTKKSGDQCWATDNATLSLKGRSVELIFEDGKGWHPRNDDGSRVARHTDTVNGDRFNEWWVVTTPDGTEYWFGKNRLPGWTDGAAVTNSTWTAPVFGNHPGEPCHTADFVGSSCERAWRWNLDYVKDPLGNTQSYWYDTQTNKYARYGRSKDLLGYTRGGWLKRIDYGTRGDTAYGTAPMQVVFGMADRCLADCGKKDEKHWPDTPFEQECTKTPCYTGSPTFWITKRLKTVTTRVGNRDVERWTLSHKFPDPGDSSRAGLWLEKISHKGLVGADTDVPDIVFTPVQMHNRVDGNDHSPSMNWSRIAAIRTETGGKINVEYSARDCVAGTRVPTAPEHNTLRCYPVKWTPDGHKKLTDYFHKYVVDRVTETDLTGRSPRVVHRYKYLGNPAWHYTDDDGLIVGDDKTWSVWRGYARVQSIVGEPGDQQTMTETRYLRGMHGDKLPGGTRQVPPIPGEGVPAVDDEDAYAGMTRETITFNGPGGAEVSRQVIEPWQSEPTATRTIHGSTVSARHTNTAATHTRTVLDGGRPDRVNTVRNTFDDRGMIVQAEDLGERGKPGDDRCVKTTYAPRNVDDWLMSYPHRVLTTALPCGQTPTGEADLLGDDLLFYDNHDHRAAPSKGLVTRTDTLTSWKSGIPSYVTTARTAHDKYGRITKARDVKNNESKTVYTPAEGGPVTLVKKINPLGWETTETMEPAWGAATRTEDANKRITDLAYDGLGRLTKVWLPGRTKTNQTASMTFAYHVRTDAPVAVSAGKLTPDGGYVTSHTLYDALLRPRQTQAPADGTGGRIITDTFYDTAGRARKTNAEYVTDGAPGTDLFTPTSDRLIPNQTVLTFDGAGRTVESAYRSNGEMKWRTAIGYGGDRTDVTPPAGDTATSTLTDIRGRTVALRQYHGPTPTGTYDESTYTYNSRDKLQAFKDPAGNTWTYGYDLRGRQVRSDDPDRGVTTSKYNDAGELTENTDARATTLAYDYDTIGRKSAVYHGPAKTAATRLAEWVYDTAPDATRTGVVRGQLHKSIRHVNGAAYTTQVGGYTVDYKPTDTTHVIPTTEPGLAGNYTYRYTYKADGSPATTELPAVGDLPQEKLTYGYNPLGKPRVQHTNLSPGGANVFLVNATTYTRYGELTTIGYRYHESQRVDRGFYYHEGTRRLKRLITTKPIQPTAVADLHHDYDPAGNITRIADTPEPGTPDTQCFRYDHLRRLTQAWTPAGGDCTPEPARPGPDTAAPYWHTYSYDQVGNRKSFTDHTTAGEVTSTYTNPDRGRPKPHTLASVSTEGPGGTRLDRYTYDETGNTKTRHLAGTDQTLTWDVEGHLSSITEPAGQTSYLYDADGNRLIRRDPAGKTLYLPGQEIRTTTSGASTATRYYNHAGRTIASRTAAGLTWLIDDHHNTAHAAVNQQTQAVTHRRQTPFGTPRGTPAGTWPNDKGFVEGTQDNTGLTHLGAREYDPTTGRFISLDPIMDLTQPQQVHGYTYANNNPVTLSDPDGLDPCTNRSCSHLYDYTPPPPPPPSTAENIGAFMLGFRKGWNNWGRNTANGITAAVKNPRAAIQNVVRTANKWNAGGTLPLAGGFCAVTGACDVALDTALAIQEGDYFRAGETVGGYAPDVVIAAASAATSYGAGAAATGAITAAARAAGLGRAASGATRISKIAPGCHSFAPATLVLMADGTTKHIKDVQIDDQVLATDPESATTEIQTVTALHAHDDTDLADVTIRTADGGTATLHTTQNHPFWDATAHAWIDAAHLQTGHQLRTTDGAIATVTSVHNFTGNQPMRDLTVDTIHTYYVMAGNTPVLVHNASCSVFGRKLDNISTHLTDRDLSAARRELNGEVVARKPDGTPWDHVHEVRDAQNGLLNVIQQTQRRLGDSRLDPGTRAQLEGDLSRASKMLDYSEKFVPR